MKLKNLITKICVVLLFLSATSFVEAQKKKSVTKKTNRTPITATNTELIPMLKDFAFVVRIDKEANVTLNIQNIGVSAIWEKGNEKNSLDKFFRDFSKLQNAKTPSDLRNSLDPIIIIKADLSLNFNEIVKIVKAIRSSNKKNIKIEIPDNRYVVVPFPPNINADPKPNPLFLLVTLEENSKIRLNWEDIAELENTSPLKEKLKDVIAAREENGVWREGTNETESTVFIKVPLSVKFSDVIKLIQPIIEAGASPIGIIVDDLKQFGIINSSEPTFLFRIER